MERNDAKPKPWEFSIRRVAPVLVVVFVLAFLYAHRSIITDHLPAPIMHMLGKKTVDDRLTEYGPVARARLKPLFAAAGVQYPPAKLVLLALKNSRMMQVYAADDGAPIKPVAVYEIQAASGHAGPKLVEGDAQVPEGIYPIVSLNPNSLFHLSMLVGYPNDFDREMAAKDGRSDLGGDIMIHGAQISAGCLAMGDQTSEDLFVLVADTGVKNVEVVISPVDFRTTSSLPPHGVYPPWTSQLYAAIRAKIAALPIANPPLPVQQDPTADGLPKNRLERISRRHIKMSAKQNLPLQGASQLAGHTEE